MLYTPRTHPMHHINRTLHALYQVMVTACVTEFEKLLQASGKSVSNSGEGQHNVSTCCVMFIVLCVCYYMRDDYSEDMICSHPRIHLQYGEFSFTFCTVLALYRHTSLTFAHTLYSHHSTYHADREPTHGRGRQGGQGPVRHVRWVLLSIC